MPTNNASEDILLPIFLPNTRYEHDLGIYILIYNISCYQILNMNIILVLELKAESNRNIKYSIFTKKCLVRGSQYKRWRERVTVQGPVSRKY